MILTPALASAAPPPCTAIWGGSSIGGEWNDSNNWSSNVPTASDVVCIPAGTFLDVAPNAEVAAIVAPHASIFVNDSLELNSSLESSIASLYFSGATLINQGELHINTLLSWTGGTLNGSGKTTINNGATANVSNGPLLNASLNNQDFQNDGSLTVTNNWNITGTATVENTASLSLSASINSASGTPRLVNTGSVTGTGILTINVPIDNDGSVSSANNSHLTFQKGTPGTATSTGSWNATSSSPITLTGTNEFNLLDPHITGRLRITGPVTTNRIIGDSTSVLDVYQDQQLGFLNITDSSSSSTVNRIELFAGTIQNQGSLSVLEGMTTYSSTLTGAGSITLPANTTSYSNSTAISTQQIINHGDWTVVGALPISGATSDVLINNDGDIYLQAGRFMLSGSGVPLLRNTGIIATLNSNSDRNAYNTNQIELALKNEGLVYASDGGPLTLRGGAPEKVSGSWEAETNTTLTFTGTKLFKLGVPSFSGYIRVTGPVIADYIDGDNTSTLDIYQDQQQGTVQLTDANAISTFKNVALFLGTITNEGTLTVTNDLGLRGGKITGSGQTTTGASSLNSSQPMFGNIVIEDQTIINNGDWTVSGQLQLKGNTGTTIFDNKNTVRLNTGQINEIGNNIIFANHGTLTTTQGSAPNWIYSNSINVAIDNRGTVSSGDHSPLGLTAGTQPGTASTGNWLAHEYAPITLTGTKVFELSNPHVHNRLRVTGPLKTNRIIGNSSSILDTYTDNFSSIAHVEVTDANATSTLNNMEIYAGTVDVAGTFDVSGTFRLAGGTIQGDGTVNILSNATGDITTTLGSRAFNIHRLNNNGHMTIRGALSGYGGAELINRQLLTLDGASLTNSTTIPILDNRKTIECVQNTTNTIDWLIQNSGSIQSSGCLATTQLGEVSWNHIRTSIGKTVNEAPNSGVGTVPAATYSVIGTVQLPPGIVINQTTGVFSGSIQKDVPKKDSRTVQIEIDPSVGATYTRNVQLTVLPTTSGQQGNGPSKDNNSDVGDPVNAVNGNVYDSHQDFLLPSRGLSTQIVRTYNSSQPTDGPFGYGWSGLYGASIDTTPRENLDGSTTQVATVADHDGKMLEFELQPDGSYDAPARIWDTLSHHSNGTWELTRRNGVKWWFNNTGKLSFIEDRNGNSLVMGYASNGQLSTITDSLSRVVEFHYTNNRVTSIEAPDNRSYSYEYDTTGNLIQFEDAAGSVWNYEYDDAHRLTKTLTPGNANFPRGSQEFHYDSAGRAEWSEGYSGHQRLEYDYDVANRETTITDARNNESIYHYDTRGMVTEIEDPDGHSLEYDFDSRGRQIATRDQRGKQTDFTYDGRGNVLTVKQPKPHTTDTESDRPTTTMTYGDYDQVETTTDPNGNLTDFDYDSHGNLISKTDAKDNETVTTYNTYGQPLAVTDARNHTTSFVYGGIGDGAKNGRLAEQTDARGKTTTFDYDAFGNVTSTTDPLNRTTTFVYDDADRLLTTTLPEVVSNRADTITNTYDPRGNLLKTTDPTGHGSSTLYTRTDLVAQTTDATGKHMDMDYDAMGNMIETTDAAGIVTELSYSKQGWLTSSKSEDGTAAGRVSSTTYRADGKPTNVTDARGNVTHYSYDDLGRLETVTDADNNDTTMTYDKKGQLLTLTNPNGHVTTFEYDELGQRIKKTDADDHQWRWYYDTVGNLDHSIDANGHQTDYSYNAVDQPTSVAFTGSTEPAITSVYDDAGQVISSNRGTRTVAYEYDAQGRLVEEDQQHTVGLTTQSRALHYAYDQAGRLSGTVLPGNTNAIGYTYDNAGRLLSTTDARGNQTTNLYDAAGRLQQQSHPGTNLGQTYAYNAAGEPNLVTLNLGSGGTRSLQYNYDKGGNVSSFADTKGSSSTTANLDYDDVNRLISESYDKDVTGSPSVNTTRDYEYDAAGNRLQLTKSTATGTSPPTTSATAYTYSDAERMMTAGSHIYNYDDNGQLQSDDDGSSSSTAVTNYSYNRAGELTGEGSDQFQYDALGRRVAEISGSSTTESVFDGDQVVQTYDGSNSLIGEYTRSSGGSIVSQYDPALSANKTQYAITDLLGSPIEVTSGGTSQEHSSWFNAYGDTRDEAGAGVSKFGYLGNQDNPSGKTQNFHARSYDAANGRFLSEDPVEGSVSNPQSLAPYNYGGENPYAHPDASGLCWVQLACDAADSIQAAGAQIQSDLSRGATMTAAGFARGGIAGAVENASAWSLGQVAQAAQAGYGWYLASHKTGIGVPDIEQIGKVIGICSSSAIGVASCALHQEFSARPNNKTEYVIKKEYVQKEMKHERFGNFYLLNDGFWWTKDLAGHSSPEGGSRPAWKMFEQKGADLKWVADVDKYGVPISGKHKGETGMIIPLKEFNSK